MPEIIDAKQEPDLAPSADQQTDRQPAQDETIEDVASKFFEKSQLEAEADKEVEAEEPKPEPEENTEPKPEEESEGKEEPKEDTAKEPPFNEHPRWKELLSERDTLQESVRQAEPKLRQWDSHRQFMERFGISDQDVASAMEILALQKTDPAKARERLAPLWKSLEDYDSERIPSDIQKMVDENEMTPAVAKQFAQMRAQLNGGAAAGRMTVEQQKRVNEMMISKALNDWDSTKRNADPDFKPKSKPTETDGLWELTAAKFSYLQTVQFAQNPADAVKNLEQAYADVKGTLARFAQSSKPTKPAPSSKRTASTPKKSLKDMSADEVVAQVAARHGISWSGSEEE